MNMHTPPHPGEILKGLYLEPLDLTITKAAAGLGITRKTLSSIVNGRASITPEMATRFEKAFHASAESWLRMQMQYDLWYVKKTVRLGRIKNFQSHTSVAHAT